MNRSLLIIICDFLLLAFLSMVKFDDIKPPAAPPPPAAQNPAGQSPEMVQVLKASLEEEQRAREQLVQTLTKTKEDLRQQEMVAQDRARRIEENQEDLQRRKEEARALAQARAALESKFAETQSNLTNLQTQLAQTTEARASLEERFTTTQSNLAKLQTQLSQTSKEAETSQARLAAIAAEHEAAQARLKAMEAQVTSSSAEAKVAQEQLTKLAEELRSRRDEAQQAQSRMARLEEERLRAEVDKTKIAGDLKVVETEQKFTAAQLDQAKQEISVARTEKEQLAGVAANLAEGVTRFADQQKELRDEVRDFRPSTANEIFAGFTTNRVSVDFRGSRPGFLGISANDSKISKSILVTDGTRHFSILHVSDTPLAFSEFGLDWDRLTGTLTHGRSSIPLSRLYFLSDDPRVVATPLEPDVAARVEAKAYRLAKDPFKFEEAVLVGATDGYYGEVGFKIDPANPSYVRMDGSMARKIVGKFSPSKGDLVFTLQGELLGMMVNSRYCLLITSFNSMGTIPMSSNLANVRTGVTLSQMHFFLNRLPLPLR